MGCALVWSEERMWERRTKRRGLEQRLAALRRASANLADWGGRGLISPRSG